MTLIIAEHAGFCKGVARAVRLARDNAPCYTLGSLIHNRAIVEELRLAGVTPAETLGEIPGGATVVIRSHGAPPSVYREIERRGLKLVDATCPDVAAGHELAREKSEEGRRVVIFGDPEHPEVKALSEWCENPLVCGDYDELCERMVREMPENAPAALLAQTTAVRANYKKCVNFFKKQCTNGVFYDTICNATSLRQEAAERLSARCDAFIVVGDVQSANTRNLADISRAGETYLVQNAEEARALKHRLPPGAVVGLTAGASAPSVVIKEVCKIMSEETRTELSFEEMLDQSFKTLTTGDKVTGTITAVTPTEIHVDLGAKQAGYIPVSELSDDPDYKPGEHLKVGDEIETFVMRVNDVDGVATLSKKRVDAVNSWEDIEAARENRNAVEGIVKEENKGGIVVSVNGIRVFVPASQSGVPKNGDMKSVMGKKVRLYVTEVNRQRRRVVGSIRAALSDERKVKSEELWENIEVGNKYDGVVKSLTSYGAFVDIGGVDGMVHVSELSWQRVNRPDDMVKPGDSLEVVVLSFDKEKRKISLGHKQLETNPWDLFTERYSVGDTAAVRVVNLTAFGAFCEVLPGVDGLIHISQLDVERVNKPSDAVKLGQELDVKITEIDEDRHKISLSRRALLETEGDDGEYEEE